MQEGDGGVEEAGQEEGKGQGEGEEEGEGRCCCREGRIVRTAVWILRIMERFRVLLMREADLRANPKDRNGCVLIYLFFSQMPASNTACMYAGTSKHRYGDTFDFFKPSNASKKWPLALANLPMGS